MESGRFERTESKEATCKISKFSLISTSPPIRQYMTDPCALDTTFLLVFIEGKIEDSEIFIFES